MKIHNDKIPFIGNIFIYWETNSSDNWSSRTRAHDGSPQQ